MALATSGAGRRAPARAGVLRLERVVRRRFGPGGGFRPELSGFLADVAALHDVPVHVPTQRNSFTEMVRVIVADVDGNGGSDVGGPFGFAVLAHSTPDAEPDLPGSLLTGGLSGGPAACGISDQGALAPFTGLAIVDAFARTATAGDRPVDRAVVVVLDQHAVVGDPVDPGPDGAVALVLGRSGGLGSPVLGRWSGVGCGEVGDLLDDLLRPGPDGVAPRVVADAALAPLLPEVDRVDPTPGLPCAGPWDALAAGADLVRGRIGMPPTVVVGYDPDRAELAACRLRGTRP